MYLFVYFTGDETEPEKVKKVDQHLADIRTCICLIMALILFPNLLHGLPINIIHETETFLQLIFIGREQCN